MNPAGINNATARKSMKGNTAISSPYNKRGVV